ncbi:MAG: glycosyltransferase family 10 [bacterium]|nr:glycosyltransferase family 10 [bacterium]
MPRIRISATFPTELILRQTPGRCGRWQEFEFVADGNKPVDGWVVYDDLSQPEEGACPAANTLLITGEPESLRRYRTRYTGQFAQVWTSHQSIRHPHLTRRNEAQHWHYALHPGRIHGCQLGFDELVRLQRPEKSRLISVICSNKAHSPDHRQRLEFVRFLKAELGEAIDVFGRGIRDMQDKSDAIYDYRYHIVLENDHSEHFMTEKLADAYLGWSYPIYFGGREAYFRYPEGSFTAIDIYEPEAALQIVKDVIAADTYRRNMEAISEARRRVLFENNICNMLAEYWRENQVRERPAQVRLLPKNRRTELVMQQFGRVITHSLRRHGSHRAA